MFEKIKIFSILVYLKKAPDKEHRNKALITINTAWSLIRDLKKAPDKEHRNPEDIQGMIASEGILFKESSR